MKQLIDGYMKAYQVPDEEREKFRGEFRPVAERQVRRDLIIETIAEREGFKSTEADIDRPRGRGGDQAGRRSRPGVRVAAEGRTPAGDRAEHHRREGLHLADRTKRDRQLTLNTNLLFRIAFRSRSSDRTYQRHMPTIYTPYIIERSPRGERSYDIFSRLLMDRIIFLGTPVNDDVANIIIAQMLFLEADNPERDIFLYINSPGGSVSAGLAIYDTMQYMKSPVNTICMGMAASMGAFLLAAGRKGKRSALPHSRIMIHQPSQSGGGGTASDIEIQAREILYLRAKMNELLAKHTGQPVERIERDTDRDRYMSAEEAKEYGLVDQRDHASAARSSSRARSQAVTK